MLKCGIPYWNINPYTGGQQSILDQILYQPMGSAASLKVPMLNNKIPRQDINSYACLDEQTWPIYYAGPQVPMLACRCLC